ncbi:MAG: hypothetical protein ACIAS6_02865 [Phycisphaerales bacterium JB060]
MGVNGSVYFYQCFGGRGTLDQRFRRVAEIVGSTRAQIVTRSRLPFTHGDMVWSDTYDEIFGWSKKDGWSLDEVASMRFATGTLHAQLSSLGWGEPFYEKLKSDTGEDIAGFYPSAPSVSLGWHVIPDLPLPDLGPDPTKHRLARFSLSLFGYGTPKHGVKYREQVFQFSAMRELETQLTEAIGPVKRAISWSV